jgi:hypothetical protein
MTQDEFFQQAGRTGVVPKATSTAKIEGESERSAPFRRTSRGDAATRSGELRDDSAVKTAETSTKSAAPSECPEAAPTDEEIRCRAHEIYRARCDSGADGDELSDWIAAECELRAGGGEGQPSTSSRAEARPSEQGGE